jgi:hypothetical protein
MREESVSFDYWSCRTFSTLTFLPPTLPVLESLSLLLSAEPGLLNDSTSQSSRLVHEFLANAGRQLESLSASEGGKDKSSRQIQMVSPRDMVNIDVFIPDSIVTRRKDIINRLRCWNSRILRQLFMGRRSCWCTLHKNIDWR